VEPDARPTLATRCAVPAALVLAALAAWSFTLTLPLTGADTWPILASARAALDEPGALLWERYLEGLWTDGRFWRPGFVALFAGQWRLFGEHAAGYHVVRLAAYVALALLAGRLAARGSAAPRTAALVAGAVVLLHPLQAETVPSVARSADVLCDLAVAGSLALLARARPSGGALAAGVACALAAPLLKEPGLVAPPLALVVLAPWRPGRARRLAALTLAAGFAANVAARFALLGTLGRYDAQVTATGPGEVAGLLLRALTASDSIAVALLVAGALGLGALVGRAPARAAPADEDGRRARTGALLWLALALAGGFVAPRFGERHAAGLLVPLGILVGRLVARHVGALADAARPPGSSPAAGGRPGSRRRAPAGAGLVLAVLPLGIALLPRSPLWRDYPQWRVIGRAAERTLDAAELAVHSLEAMGEPQTVEFGAFTVRALPRPGGTCVTVAPFPFQAAPPTGARSVALSHPMILKPYAVRAGLILRGCGPGVRVVKVGGTTRVSEAMLGDGAPR